MNNINNKIISFPHMGDYCYFIKPFLENITNMEVKISPPITKKTIEIGDLSDIAFITNHFFEEGLSVEMSVNVYAIDD